MNWWNKFKINDLRMIKNNEEDWFFYIVSEIDWKFTEELINGKLKWK